MPREQVRKRGKRKPKIQQEGFDAPARPTPSQSHPEPVEPVADVDDAVPSGIHPARAALLAGRRPPPPQLDTENTELGGLGGDGEEQTLEWTRGPRVDSDYPYGELDPDLKAYFRNVDDQIRDWEGVSSVGEEREDRQMFLTSVLSELRGHELTVATDPDTAVVLERLMPSLGDWGRRVIGDAFGDQVEMLIRHRFGSHVVQTWLTLAADTLDRESNIIYPPQHHEQAKLATTDGVLPTMTTLVQNILHLLQPTLSTLLANPHASPPLRLLFIILTPSRAVPPLNGGNDSDGMIRSKKSGKYRKGQAVQGKSIFGDDEDKGKGKVKARAVSPELVVVRKEIIEGLMKSVSPVEWRSMGVNGVGSAAVQLLLELEVEEGRAERLDSLLDILTEGLVSDQTSTETETPPQYPATLLTTPIGSRLFETILRVSPQPIFNRLWTLYFERKIGKLAGHPFANFVVARGVSRSDETQVEGVVRECKAVSGGRTLIKTARTSVLQALADRAAILTSCQNEVMSLVQSAISLPDTDKTALVPCLMALKTYPIYQSIKSGKPLENDEDIDLPAQDVDVDAEETAAAAARYEGWKNRRNPKLKDDGLGPNMQGCLLLQGLVRMGAGNDLVLQSLLAQNIDTLLEYAYSPISSHLLDVVLTCPAVVPKWRRKLIAAVLGRYTDLAQDRMGSRVADTIWANADGFMKEKIAKSLISDANLLASSQFGRFLAMKVDLHLLERRPDEWRQKHLGVTGGRARGSASNLNGHSTVRPTTGEKRMSETEGESEDEARKKKRTMEGKDEIDDLFSGVERKRKRVKS